MVKENENEALIMEPLMHWRYRSKARILAYVDLFLTSISMLLTLFCGLIVVFLMVIILNPKVKQDMMDSNTGDFKWLNEDGLLIWVICSLIVFIILSIVGIVQFVAVVKFLQATRIGMDVDRAGKQARFWLKYDIIGSPIPVFLFVLGMRSVSPWLAIFCFTVYILIKADIVGQFILELDARSNKERTTLTIPVKTEMEFSRPSQTQRDQTSALIPCYADVVNEKI